MDENIQEWHQSIGYLITRVVNRVFEASTQDYPGVRHEHEVMHKKLDVLKFPIITYPMRSIWRNRETFLADAVEFNHAGEKCWGLVLYGVKTKLINYYRLGSKEHTTQSILDKLGQLIIKHRIYRQLVPYSHIVLGARNLWKRFLGLKCTPLFLSKLYNHNHIPVDLTI